MQDDRDDRKELEKIQNQLAQAWMTRDRSTIERILAPEWMVTHTDGRISSKEEVLRDFDTGNNRPLEGHVDDIKVRLFDGFAIVHGRTHARGAYGGHPHPHDVILRFTGVFVRRSQQWQAIASHASRMASRENITK